MKKGPQAMMAEMVSVLRALIVISALVGGEC